MSKTVIKELQKLMALCVEINSQKKHRVSFNISGSGIPYFRITVYENGVITMETANDIATVNKATLPNINKCRQKLLKYKEW